MGKNVTYFEAASCPCAKLVCFLFHMLLLLLSISVECHLCDSSVTGSKFQQTNACTPNYDIHFDDTLTSRRVFGTWFVSKPCILSINIGATSLSATSDNPNV